MATWITQAKDLFGALTNGVLPSNPTLIQHTKSMARRANGSFWKANLARHGLVVNPDGSDLFDIGTLIDSVYTPTPAALNTQLAFSFRERVRAYVVSEIKSDRQESDTIDAADIGTTPAEAIAANRQAAHDGLLVDIGDPDNDPES